MISKVFIILLVWIALWFGIVSQMDLSYFSPNNVYVDIILIFVGFYASIIPFFTGGEMVGGMALHADQEKSKHSITAKRIIILIIGSFLVLIGFREILSIKLI